MPRIFYSEAEYQGLEFERDAYKKAYHASKALEPVWAQSLSAQISATALAQLWELLDVKDQTSAVTRLKQLLERDERCS